MASGASPQVACVKGDKCWSKIYCLGIMSCSLDFIQVWPCTNGPGGKAEELPTAVKGSCCILDLSLSLSIFLNVCVCACVYECAWQQRPWEVVRFSRVGSSRQLWAVSRRRLGPLREQPLLFTVEPSLHLSSPTYCTSAEVSIRHSIFIVILV